MQNDFAKCKMQNAIAKFKMQTIQFLKKFNPVRKLPEANDKTVTDFKKIDGKNRFFSIFFKLSQTVSSDVKMVPKCFATLKATPKASGHILRSFENFFSNRIFDLQKPIFAQVATLLSENGILWGCSKPKGFFQMIGMA